MKLFIGLEYQCRQPDDSWGTCKLQHATAVALFTRWEATADPDDWDAQVHWLIPHNGRPTMEDWLTIDLPQHVLTFLAGVRLVKPNVTFQYSRHTPAELQVQGMHILASDS